VERTQLLPLTCAALALAFAAGCGGDDAPREPAPAAIRVSSPAFTDGSRLAEKYTCDGAGKEPAVKAGTVPASTRELLVIVADPDAHVDTFVHLTRYGLERTGDGSLDKGGREGENSDGDRGWTPPCPPRGDGPHRYVWAVYALGEPSGLPAGAPPDDVIAAIDDVIAQGQITARYERLR
jgi:phosphatidylethanolamine-binding protein (PEBP) family uncharacterized protein